MVYLLILLIPFGIIALLCINNIIAYTKKSKPDIAALWLVALLVDCAGVCVILGTYYTYCVV